MRKYVEKYIKCCVLCLYSKRTGGKPEGYLYPIPKLLVPFHTIHVDHVGPFPRSKKGNLYLITAIDAFTKFCIPQAVKSTKARYVIDYLEVINGLYGTPRVLITDRRSAFISKVMQMFCQQRSVKHILTSVATPRANGQVERLNRVIKNALLSYSPEEEYWNKSLNKIQLSINSTISKTTGKTPTELLYGHRATMATEDLLLIEDIIEITPVIEDLVRLREEANTKMIKAQQRQNRYYNRRRKRPLKYEVLLVEKQHLATGGRELKRTLYRINGDRSQVGSGSLCRSGYGG